DRPQVVRVFARLANFGRAAREVTATLSLDGTPARAVRRTIPPGGVTPVQLEITLPGAALMALELAEPDAPAADHVARLVLAPSRRLSVLLVTNGNWLLESSIRSAGVRRLVTMTPEKYEVQDPAYLARGGWDDDTGSGGEQGFDVIVFDAYAPRRVPP